MLGPVIRGDRICLGPTTLADLPLFRAWRADLEVIRLLPYRSVPSARQHEEWYDAVTRSESEVLWSVTLDGRTIGQADISIYWTSRSGRTGLLIGEPSAWGKGYGSEVVRLRARYAFEELGLERLEADSLAENFAMHRALEKAGYQHVGTRHRYVYGGGAWHDSYLFELLRESWLSSAQ